MTHERFTREWFDVKSEPFLKMVTAHAQSILAEEWLSWREMASQSDPDGFMPDGVEHSPESILSMSRESVIRRSCVWEGISITDVRFYPHRAETIGEIDGQPVLYVAYHGKYFWQEPEQEELVTATLGYPLEFVT